MEEKKSSYKGYTPAQGKATQKYLGNNMEQVRFWVHKGERETLKAEAKSQGQSMAQYVVQAVNDRAGYQVLTPAERPQQEE